jgi:hypothetical protein
MTYGELRAEVLAVPAGFVELAQASEARSCCFALPDSSSDSSRREYLGVTRSVPAPHATHANCPPRLMSSLQAAALEALQQCAGLVGEENGNTPEASTVKRVR